MNPLRGIRTVRFALLLAAGAPLLLVGARRGSAEECRKKICRDDYHFDGKSCRSVSGLNWRSHYTPESPVCPAGWEVKGDSCVKKVCCEKRVCNAGERYRDGYCWSGPSGIGGYKSHRKASCDPGWDFDPVKGVCGNPACRLVAGGPIVVHPWQPFRITGYEPAGCVRKGGGLTVLGSGFGGSRGPNLVELGGHGVGIRVAPGLWSNTRIVLTVPDDPRLQNGQWYYAGIQNAQGNWISNIDRNFTVCR
jgi:hypothetical protein